ncbi:MAG: hypothetical protein NVS9B8_12140 [Candidatus Limnocylindrales bacterium]
MLDNDELDPGGRKALEALGGVHQERWRVAEEDGVGVGVERDDGRSGGAGAGLSDEVLEQVRVAAVKAVEHADRDEEGAIGRIEPASTADCLHAGASMRTLSGASVVPRSRAIATS